MLFGIVGNGFVGQATKLLSSSTNKCLVYDIDPSKCEPPGISPQDLKQCKVIFICVPTPANEDGSCNTTIVETCVKQLFTMLDPTQTFIVCRSTVIMGTCDKLDIYHMPEFLTERNWRNDFLNCKTWIFGQPAENPVFQETIRELFGESPVSGEMIFTQNACSELVKYARNTFLTTKVSFCNELESICKYLNIDYHTVQALFAADPRIGPSHTAVPGTDGTYGFGGHCFPKDLAAMVAFMEHHSVSSYILRSVQERNLVDRHRK